MENSEVSERSKQKRSVNRPQGGMSYLRETTEGAALISLIMVSSSSMAFCNSNFF